jgi:hypothetical protein
MKGRILRTTNSPPGQVTARSRGFEGLFFARVTDYSDTTLVTRRLGDYPETGFWDMELGHLTVDSCGKWEA